MSRICWLFVFLAVVTPPSDARPHNCEQKGRALAGLDLAEDSLNRAKDLYPNCEDENEISNSSECSRKDKSLGFIDVALNLVSDAKKNMPVCPDVTTKESKTQITTEVPTPDVTTEEEPTTKVTSQDCPMDCPIDRPMDCQDLLVAGYTKTGVYRAWPRSRVIRGKAIRVRCDMDTDGGGWTVIQRRGNFSQQENFFRDWKDYKDGFGEPSRDFWIGNDNIFALSHQDAYSLRIDMKDAQGNDAYDVYEEFWIEDEDAQYKLHVGKHISGNAGDSMTYHNGNMFSTKDRKNDHGDERTDCATYKKSGFWHDDCAWCNANGDYQPGQEHAATVYYWSLKKFENLFSIEMKLRRLP